MDGSSYTVYAIYKRERAASEDVPAVRDVLCFVLSIYIIRVMILCTTCQCQIASLQLTVNSDIRRSNQGCGFAFYNYIF